MKDYFSTMRLWIVSLLTLGAVLIQGPAQAQSIGPLKETYDGGKTWQPEGTGRPNRGSSGEGYTPSVSPEEAARQQAEAEEARRHDAGYNANQEGLEYQKQGNWDAAVQAYENALQNWDHEIIRSNLANAKEQARLQRERAQQEQEQSRRDAVATESIKQSVDRLVTILGDQSATVNFDSPTAAAPRSGGGLDFITDPAAVLSKPAVSNAREPNTDPNVVDLRDAKTFTVDPARVKGTATTSVPQQQLEFLPIPTPNSPGDPNNNRQNAGDPASEKFSKAAGEALRDSLAAQQTGNPQTKVEADKRLQTLSQEEAQRFAQQQAEAHKEMLYDMEILQINGDKFVIALEEAKARVRAKELTALKVADDKYDKDAREYLNRLRRKDIKLKDEEVDAIIERRRTEQAAAVKKAYDEMAAEVQHLKKQLLAETKGRPEKPLISKRNMDLLSSTLFSDLPEKKDSR